MKLEDIGFYTLSDERAINSSSTSQLKRCELILTDRCNFKCVYCRGLRKDVSGDMPFDKAITTLNYWLNDGLESVRFSGGEPTLYSGLLELVALCKLRGCKNIAISSNGSATQDFYDRLIDAGVNDFSISLDGGCCVIGDEMAGVSGTWDIVIKNIKHIATRVYTTVGAVFTGQNVSGAIDTVLFASSLGVSDIRIISAAQYNEAINRLRLLPEKILQIHPILRYRIHNMKEGRGVRGIGNGDSKRCSLVLDDMAVAGDFHFPCIIYMREGGNPIGRVGKNMREQRRKWSEGHCTHTDKICKEMCLDVCIDYNNKACNKCREER